MSSENFTKYMNDLNRRIFDLVNSSDENEKLGAIMVIGEQHDPVLPLQFVPC
jgi:FKBP12-rapamycin complex-associated protein